jgi:hypothetical protein
MRDPQFQEQTMPVGSRHPSTTESQKADDVVFTPGGIFSNEAIDWVGSCNPCRPNLIAWDGKRVRIAPRIHHAGIWYEAPELNRSLGLATRLPIRLDQDESGVKLFSEVSDWSEEYLALPPDLAKQVNLFMASTWLADMLPNPPILIVLGQQMGPAINLFRWLGCGCRRPLPITGINRAALVGLPMHFGLTLLINQPDLPPALSKLLCSSNYRGVHVPGGRGTIQNWVGSRAIFLDSPVSARAWRGNAIWITLPAGNDVQPIDERSLDRMAEHLQARFLNFRLKWLLEQNEADVGRIKSSFPGSGLAQALLTCVRNEPDLVKTVTPFLRGLVEEEELGRQNHDPSLVIFDVLWIPAHQVPHLSVTQITERLNMLLRSRGSNWEHSAEEVGWLLKSHGFDRHRNGSGMELRFSANHMQLLHHLVRKFRLNLPKMPGCVNCKESESTVTEMPAQDV